MRGSLEKEQISEIVSLLKKGTYLESDYFQSFFNYNDLYHGNGILLCEYEDIYNSSDMDSLSKGDWEFLEGEEEIADVSVKDGIFLITCRIQEVYFNARLESSAIVESAVKLTALCDLLSPMDNIFLLVLSID